MWDMLIVSKPMIDDMIKIAEASPDKETCGLFLGNDKDEGLAEADEFYNVTNMVTDNSIDYIMEPQQQFDILNKSKIYNKQADKDLVCIWHTHPFGMPIPSHIDINRVSYNVVYMIYGMATKQVKCWKFNKELKGFQPVDLFVLGGEQNEIEPK